MTSFTFLKDDLVLVQTIDYCCEGQWDGQDWKENDQ